MERILSILESGRKVFDSNENDVATIRAAQPSKAFPASIAELSVIGGESLYDLLQNDCGSQGITETTSDDENRLQSNEKAPKPRDTKNRTLRDIFRKRDRTHIHPGIGMGYQHNEDLDIAEPFQRSKLGLPGFHTVDKQATDLNASSQPNPVNPGFGYAPAQVRPDKGFRYDDDPVRGEKVDPYYSFYRKPDLPAHLQPSPLNPEIGYGQETKSQRHDEPYGYDEYYQESYASPNSQPYGLNALDPVYGDVPVTRNPTYDEDEYYEHPNPTNSYSLSFLDP